MKKWTFIDDRFRPDEDEPKPLYALSPFYTRALELIKKGVGQLVSAECRHYCALVREWRQHLSLGYEALTEERLAREKATATFIDAARVDWQLKQIEAKRGWRRL